MPCLLITYDVKGNKRDAAEVRRNIREVIRENYQAHLFLSVSTYAIATDWQPELVLQDMEIRVASAQRKRVELTIYVISLSQPWDGECPDNAREWLNRHLPVIQWASPASG
ncbi:hypothetical protein [Roseibium sp.]|uniref:hypothetical protein n=1 Tax=Roseibium sp. TaxID=1936156 RepID=UPI003B506A73